MRSKERVNPFTHGSIARVYVNTALPIVFVVCVSGLVSVLDAVFLGYYVGPDALASVTLMFPVYMLIVALSTLVSSGMSSIVSRNLGAGDNSAAQEVFVGAHGLAISISCFLILLFMVFGKPMALLASGQTEGLAKMGYEYLRVIVLFSPLALFLSINLDALRVEGRIAFMTTLTLLVSLVNVVFNYLLIGIFEMGTAGAALGTALAQAVALAIVMRFRRSGETELSLSSVLNASPFEYWSKILVLGAPQSLGFIGQALGSIAIIAALQSVEASDYSNTISAYGIATRILIFAYLPLLGLSFSMQAICGNNFGAELWGRSNFSLKAALIFSGIYCGLIQFLLAFFSYGIANFFVSDPAVVSEFVRIMPSMTLLYVLLGPHMILAAYFQVIGSANKAAVLSLTKPFVFIIPLVVVLPFWFGENVIWLVPPIAEFMLLLVTILLLFLGAKEKTLEWGLFRLAPRSREE